MSASIVYRRRRPLVFRQPGRKDDPFLVRRISPALADGRRFCARELVPAYGVLAQSSAMWGFNVQREIVFVITGALLFAAFIAPVAEASSTQAPSRGRCVGYLPEISFGATIAPRSEREVFSWTTTCTSTTYASVSGNVSVSIQKQVPGGWEVRATGGYAHVPDLGPGTYRLVIKNISVAPAPYTVRHRRGLG